MNSGSKIESDYGQEAKWTKSPEDNQRHHIPAQAKPSRRDLNLTPSDFKPVGCIGIAAPKGSVLVEVLASNTHMISKLNSEEKGLAIEAAASSTNNL